MPRHFETHYAHRTGWLRAAVLGANDGIVSTASLLVGVIAAAAGHAEVLIAGTAGLVAGALSMAAGEYVSVSSQADMEQADLARERRELESQPEAEHRELSLIYQKRGLSPALAAQVAEQLMARDALAAHARDELGFSALHRARPIQAALASAASFAAGAAVPLLLAVFSPTSWALFLVGGGSLAGLAILGALAARAGGAGVFRGVLRVGFWGALAMAVTAGVGSLFGVAA